MQKIKSPNDTFVFWNISSERCFGVDGKELKSSLCQENNNSIINANDSDNMASDDGYQEGLESSNSLAIVESMVKMLILVVIPTVSILGVAGNLIGIVIISKNGLQKTSNILLVCLSTADATFLVAVNNIPWFIYKYVGGFGFPFSEPESRFLFISYVVFNSFHMVGLCCSMTVPALITIERLVAILFPLYFRTVVTPARTWSVVAVFFIYYSGSMIILGPNWYRFYYVQTNYTSFGVVAPSFLRQEQPTLIKSLLSILNILTGIVPLSIVISGSAIISVKIALAARQRGKMTSSSSATKSAATSQATRTLLAVCLVFAVTGTYRYIIDEIYNVTVAETVEVAICRAVKELVIVLNSSCNFIIYVATNKNFRVFRSSPRKGKEVTMPQSRHPVCEENARCNQDT